ncbi:MAG: N-6 DNA methylase [Bacteroides sp.]|nr:N-6 DNA methylase [Bacteroides sp.]
MTAGRKVYSSSQSWCTPHKYVEALHCFWPEGIELDPCSNPCSIVNARHEFTLPDTDGLLEDWDYASIYVNPPYGTDHERHTTIKHWLQKCADARERFGAEVVALVPVATNTSHWKQYVFGKADAVCFLYDTRLKFLVNGSSDNKGAPMACCLIYWGDDLSRFNSVFKSFGAVVSLTSLKTSGELNISSLFEIM